MSSRSIGTSNEPQLANTDFIVTKKIGKLNMVLLKPQPGQSIKQLLADAKSKV